MTSNALETAAVPKLQCVRMVVGRAAGMTLAC
jgi:hypothetical protein